MWENIIMFIFIVCGAIVIVPVILWVWFYAMAHAILTVLLDLNFKSKNYGKKEEN